MKKLISVIVFAGALIVLPMYAADDVHWNYTGDSGPENWGELADEFSVCSSGKNQSPINLSGMIKGELPELAIDYVAGGSEVINNGHTIQVNYTSGSVMSIGKHDFELKQVHFHSPSENTIRGQSFPMEAHFVHIDVDDNLAVVAVMFETGEFNAELEKVWEQMPHEGGEVQIFNVAFNAKELMPRKHDYYRFNGSLTTPPCTEGVNWLVMRHFNEASAEQIQKFVDVMQRETNRPVQPLNARSIIQ